MALELFHPAVTDWFNSVFPEPTACQTKAWPAIKSHSDTLIAAPTGSGKTLAAFLAAIDDLVRDDIKYGLPDETRVLYISPLKALSNDIQKNLQIPLEGISDQLGDHELSIRAMVRTGDTPQSERTRMRRLPPHILVTTPESLYILLTSDSGRDMLRTVRTVIVDEIHAIVNSKRGSHLSLSLERLAALTDKPPVRIGLSATQKPINKVASFLTGHENRQCHIVDTGYQQDRDLKIEIPNSPLESMMSGEVWTEVYQKVIDLIEEHHTTIVFVNTRRMAERVARHLSEHLGEENVTSHHGSLSRKQRLNAETRLKSGDLKALVATASLELGIDIGDVDLVCQLGSTRSIATFLQRSGRANHAVGGLPKARLFPLSRDELVEAVALFDAIQRGELDHLIIPQQPLDVLSQQIVAMVACEEWNEDDLFDRIRKAWPYRNLSREDYDEVITMLSEGFSTRRGRRGAYLHRDSINSRLRARKGAKLTAVTSGGAIPDTADYEVRLEPGGTFVGTLDEDFAIESLAGDIFQLGNTSWRILRVESGTVRVQDAKGQPPSIPFWMGEAPARSFEFSFAVSRLRSTIDKLLEENAAEQWLSNELQLEVGVIDQVVSYLHAGRNALGMMPTMDTLVVERFFDESGGMQLVLHSPFGSRVNRGWGLALRKRFCRQFNFELQAAATEDAIILSLGETHSFPLDDVWKFLNSKTVRQILIQAMLDAPMFATRWRWVASCALAIPRFRGGKKVPARLQRMNAEDLVSVVFPEQLACLENIAGDREIPDHPLVDQTVDDCLNEAMDIDSLIQILEDIEAGKKTLITRDLTEPSPLAQAILTANPYAFLDGAPAEERRTQAVISRRWIDPEDASDIGKLDPDAIQRVREEAWPDAQTPDELHDALLVLGFLTEKEIDTGPIHKLKSDQTTFSGVGDWKDFLERLMADGRVRFLDSHKLWIAVERSDWFESLFSNSDSPEKALLEILRCRIEGLGPVTIKELASPLDISENLVTGAMLSLENEGYVLQGKFTAECNESEWCERRLLARIHRYTVKRLRKEIEPVSIADFMRFLFSWQHLTPGDQLEGAASVYTILEQLEGFIAPARSWENSILTDRIRHYQPDWLDQSCLSGHFTWLRGNNRGHTGSKPSSLKATPVTFIQRRNIQQLTCYWQTDEDTSGLSDQAQQIFDHLTQNGACFHDDLFHEFGDLETLFDATLAGLITAGLIASDSFSGLRKYLRSSQQSKRLQRARRRTPSHFIDQKLIGRWSIVKPPIINSFNLELSDQIETLAMTLLKRYGVIFRRLVDRENGLPRWRDLLMCYRRLEAQGKIRGGRFVSTVTGEQFALPEAVGSLRSLRRGRPDGQLISICAADPLNLTGILLPGPRIPSQGNNRIVFRDGLPVAAKTGKEVKLLQKIDPADDWKIKNILIRQRTNSK